MLLALPLAALAQVLPPNPGLPGNPNADVNSLALNIIQIILSLVGLFAVLFIIIGGFQYILSGANEDLAKRGKTTVQNAIIGLIIVILSYVIVTVVVNTLF